MSDHRNGPLYTVLAGPSQWRGPQTGSFGHFIDLRGHASVRRLAFMPRCEKVGGRESFPLLRPGFGPAKTATSPHRARAILAPDAGPAQMNTPHPVTLRRPPAPPPWRLWPVAGLAAGLAVFLVLGLHEYFRLESLARNRDVLAGMVADHAVLAAIGFVALYAVVVALSLPVALVVSMAGGFLFGGVGGAVLNVIAASLGATALFLIARSTVGAFLRARAGPWLTRMEAGFHANEWSYMFILRLVPLFPFYIVNIVPALIGVRLTTFVVATFFGIMPGAIVYANLGAGADVILTAGETPGLDVFLAPQVALPIGGLVLLALLPIAYKLVRARRKSNPAV